MKELRAGIIGLSRRSAIATDFLTQKGAKITAVADVDPAKLSSFEKDAFKTLDYRELLLRDDVDAVFIMTQDQLHEEMGVAALEAGKSVFLEKPMAISIEGCDRLLETAFRTGTSFFWGIICAIRQWS